MAGLIAKVEAACNAYMSARNPLQQAELEKRCKVLKKEKEDCQSSYACRMDTVREQLQKLNSDIDDLASQLKTAQDNWLKALDAQREATLEKVYEDLKKRLELLDTRRAKLEDKLPSSGEHTWQTAFAEAASAAVGTCAQERLSDSWLESCACTRAVASCSYALVYFKTP